MNYINCTPHAIILNDGTSFEPSGKIARVSVEFTDFDENHVCEQKYGDVIDLPEPKNDNVYIVSALVLSALNGVRRDVVAPATGHKSCVRNDKGQILSVPGFVK